MNFSTFLIEDIPFNQKPRVRANGDGTFTQVQPPVQKKRSAPKKKMVARELYPHLQANQSPGQPVVSSDVLDFNKKDIGKVARPQQQLKAGQRPPPRPRAQKVVPPPAPTKPTMTPITPVQQAQQQQLKQALAVKHGKMSAQPVSAPQSQDQIVKQILAIANQAAANKNTGMIDQILSTLQNARAKGVGRVAPGVQMRDEAGKEAMRIWRQAMRGSPEFRSMVAQQLTNMAATGGRRS